MSNTENHKKAINITASCRGKKGLLTDIYYQILADHPSAIINAFEKVVKRHGESGVSPGYGPWQQRIQPLYQCPDCKEFVDKIGIGGACIKCDVAEFDGHH